MREKRRDLLLGYFAFIFAITLLFVLINSLTGRTEDHWRFIYAFTQQSNILVLIWLVLFGLSAFGVKKLDGFVRNRIIMTALAVYISITYFIVALVLDPVYAGAFNPVKDGGELWLHHLSPIVVWIFFFLVEGKGSITKKQSFLTLIYPLLYVIANLVIGANVLYANGDRAYAYDFINPHTYGNNYFIFLIVILVLLAIFSLFAILLGKLKLYFDKNYHDISLDK